MFDPDTVRGEKIKEGADYEGVRVRFIGTLDNARVTMQIDVGFGDVVHPGPVETELPTILDSPAPRLLCYTRESAIAEKFEAMVKLGELNGRMKDFYDIWLLSRQFEFNGAELVEAVRLTFEHRGTELPEVITAFTDDFVSSKQGQWRAFHKRLGQACVPADFAEIVVGVKTFMQPAAAAVYAAEGFKRKWSISEFWV